MTLLMAISELPKKYNDYYNTLIKRCSCFGIDPKSIENIEYPVLVRVINSNSEKHCEYYSRIFNESLKLKMDNMDMAISYIKSLGTDKIVKLATNISHILNKAGVNSKATTLRQVMNYEDVMPIFIELLTNAKIINDTNGATFIDEEGYLKPEAELVIEYMFYAMLFDNKRVIMYAINSNYIKIEKVFSLMLEIKTLQKPFNILPEFSTALEKLKAGKSSTKQKLDADDVYEQENMYDIWRVRHIEYLCMKLLEMKNDKAQRKIFEHYLNLVKGYTTGFFTPSDKSEITPEKLLEMSFDDAKVRYKLNNLGDKKPQRKNEKTILEKIITWFKNDFNKPYRWEE